MFTDGVPDPKVMAEMTLPLIKAVADAGRLRISEGVSLDEDKTSKNMASGGNLKQRNMLMHFDDAEGELPEGVFQNTDFDSGQTNREVFSEDSLEKESTSDMPGQAIQDKNIPQSFASANNPIFSKIEKHDTKASDDKKIMPTLFSLERSDNLTLDGVIDAFRTNDAFWKFVQLPKPTKKFEDYAYSQKLKKHGNYKTFRRLILKDETVGQKPKVAGQKSPKQKQFLFEEMEGDSALGSSYALSSGMQDRYTRLSFLKRLAEKAGLDDETKDKYRKTLENFDFKTAVIDQSAPVKKVVEDFLKEVGIEDQNLIDAIDVGGLWHQYYGKGYNTVEQSQIQYVQPIKDAMVKHGVSNEMLGRYLLFRAAPSRNLRLKKMYKEYLKDLDSDSAEYKGLQKMLNERGDSLSGIETEYAIEQMQEMEKTPAISGFIDDATNPLQAFYDMNREALQLMQDGGLIRKGDIDEMKAMVTSMQEYPISKHSKAKLKDDYSYAPMQGFEGETETLFDNEQAYEAVGKSSASAGKGWDQPKHVLMNKGAFGRMNNIAPDPNTVFAVAQSQYFNAAIRAHKNTVSQSFGRLYEFMREISYPELYEGASTLPAELQNLDEAAKTEIKKQFDELFEKDSGKIDVKQDYKIEEKKIVVDGKDVPGLKMYRKTLNPSLQNMRNDPLLFVYRKMGEPHMIKFKPKGAKVAVAVKNLRYESLPRILQFFNTITRYLARVFTSLNPAFIIPNFFRDLQSAAIHLSETDKKDVFKGTFKRKRLTGFMKAIFKTEIALAKGEKVPGKFPMDKDSAQELLRSGDYAKMYQFAKAAGAKIGYFKHETVPELIQQLRDQKPKSKKGARKFLKNMVDYVDSANTAVENSIRMSAFWSAIEAGRTPQQAATISRNVTVDFNQKGNLTQTFGSLFVFFGASMNSADRFYRTLKNRTPQERKMLIGGIIAASFGVAMFNRLFDDDDDEEMPDYDTINSYKRDTSLIIPGVNKIPGFEDKTGRDTGAFSIPLALGYNVFWALGQTTADIVAKYWIGRGGIGPLDWFSRNASSVANAFNPIGGATLSGAFIPSFGKPIVELMANENFMGSPIRKEDRQFGSEEPAFKMDPKRTQEFWTTTSEAINKFMGGDDNIKGSVGGIFGGNPALAKAKGQYQFDMSGSEMEHLVMGYTAGPGQLINYLFGDLVWPMMSDKEYDLDINKAPIFNRFLKTTTYGSATRRAYYDLRDSILPIKDALADAQKVGPAEAAIVRKKHGNALQWLPQLKYMDGRLSKFRDLKKKIENSKLSHTEKSQRIEDLERKELNMLTESIKKAQALGLT